MDATNWQQTLNEFTAITKRQFEKEVFSIILFGSFARGDSGPSSDIDLLLVIDDSVEIKQIEKDVDEIASRVSLKYDKVISLVYFNRSRFEKRFEPLLVNIRKEGLKVA